MGPFRKQNLGYGWQSFNSNKVKDSRIILNFPPVFKGNFRNLHLCKTKSCEYLNLTRKVFELFLFSLAMDQIRLVEKSRRAERQLHKTCYIIWCMVKLYVFEISRSEIWWLFCWKIILDLSVYCLNTSNIQSIDWWLTISLLINLFDYSRTKNRSWLEVANGCVNVIKNYTKNCT